MRDPRGRRRRLVHDAPIGAECPEGFQIAADGRCWRVDTGPPDWECEARCADLYGFYGYCFHPGAWRDWWEDHDPTVNAAMDVAKDSGGYYTPGICAEWASCASDGVACAAVGEACSNDHCVTECSVSAHCDPQSGFPLRYPPGFECSLQQTCRLP